MLGGDAQLLGVLPPDLSPHLWGVHTLLLKLALGESESLMWVESTWGPCREREAALLGEDAAGGGW